MNKKLQKLLQPSVGLTLLILVIFAVVTYFLGNTTLSYTEGVVALLLIIYALLDGRHRRKNLIQYLESVTYNVESAKNDTLLNFPLPMAVFKLSDQQIVWGNQVFFRICGHSTPSFGANLSDLVPGFSGKWLTEGKTQCPGLIELNGRQYQIHGNIVRSNTENSSDHMGITYWVDVTDYEDIRLEYLYTRPIVAIIVLDNYEELLKNVPDRTKTELRSAVDEQVEKWCSGKEGFVQLYDRDRYVFIFEERYLQGMIDNKFLLLDMAHKVVSPTGIHATMSIGIGRDGKSYEENFSFASLSIEMALSRGGDQAVVKNRYNFEFFGGRGSEVETRTKVKSRVTANALAELIRDSSQVYSMGHKFGDLDTVGGAVGICCIARKLGKKAFIVIDPDSNASQKVIAELKKLPEYENAFISPEEAMLSADSRTLLVVVDTNRPEQVEDESLLQSCNRVAVIDHHRRAASYIKSADLTFHEPYASSVCELMTELLQELVEQKDILRREAEAILAGVVLDTKNFTIRTGERTFEAAAFLRRAGADTTEVKKLLQNDMEDTVARYKILQSARLYKGAIAIAAPETPQERVVAAQAADELLNIAGVQASAVLYPTEDGGVIVSARSIGDINVQVLLEGLGGGGNKSAAGAQMKNISVREATNQLLAAVDAYLEN